MFGFEKWKSRKSVHIGEKGNVKQNKWKYKVNRKAKRNN